MVILMALGVGCDGLKCSGNMANRAMHNIYTGYWYADMLN